MKNYRQLVKELPSKTVVFSFGRFSPPTIGHELLFKVVKKTAANHNADHVIYASRTQDKKKNPLSIDRKMHFLKLMFKGINFVPANDDARTFIEAVKNLNKKYKNIIMVAGSDRVAEYEKILNKYNGKDFKYDTIQVVSAGERDPDSDAASGMSASKMRAAAQKGNYLQFKKGLPNTVRDIDGKILMNAVRNGMGLDPIKEEVKFTIDVLRDKYFKGEIYHIGDLVESAGNQYEIVDRGSNYLVVVDKTGELHRKWVKDVTLCESITEDIQPGYAPKEISYKGYTTKNLHHTADASKAFSATIERANKGLIDNDPVAILNALKATDTYMKLNDMHLEQGKSLDEKELQQWIDSHETAKKYLEKLGEFPHHLDYWNTHKTELQLMSNNFKETGKGEFNEELTKKTLRPNTDKIKVARIIADMLGVENAEKMSSPEQLVNAGLRKLKTKTINKELLNVVSKMLDLATEVGIKYDHAMKPQKLKEQMVDYNSDYNLAGSILSYADYLKLKKMNNGEIITPHQPPGHTLAAKDDQHRRRKVKYKLGEEKVECSKCEGEGCDHCDGKGYHMDESCGKNHKLKEAIKIGKVANVKDDSHQLGANNSKGFDAFFEEDLDDKELEKMASSISHEDDILDVYDDDELHLVDDETGEEIKEEVEESQQLIEVLSKIERMRAKMRFARTQSKRTRRMKIALRKHSPAPVLNKRARRLAVKLLKTRLARKPLKNLSIGEKERIERMVEKKKQLVNRLAMRLVPRIRTIEKNRLSHTKATKGSSSPAVGF